MENSLAQLQIHKQRSTMGTMVFNEDTRRLYLWLCECMRIKMCFRYSSFVCFVFRFVLFGFVCSLFV